MTRVSVAALRLATAPGEPWLANLVPYAYQRRATELVEGALARREDLALFLVSPTGSGKTLAAYAASIRLGEPAIGVYPTNELLRDQERALGPFYGGGAPSPLVRADREALDDWEIALEQHGHGSTLQALFQTEKVVLTNPDILFYVGFGLYPGGLAARRKKVTGGFREVLWRLMAQYRLFVFDEFHLYSVKQEADVAFLVAAIRAANLARGGRVFVFSSATPNVGLIGLLGDGLGLSVQVLEAEPAGDVQEAATVVHDVELELFPAELEEWQTVDTLAEALGRLEELAGRYPAARHVLILDSVAGAMAAAERLRQDFPRQDVCEVHGLSSRAEREAALTARVTVGTSTIEVGVDFVGEHAKDVLLFEARTSASFLQRFGRIGRHAKAERIPNYALALVPPYVHAYLSERWQGVAQVDRAELRQAVEEAYRQPEAFHRYLRRYASVTMAEAGRLVLHMFQPDVKPAVRQELEGAVAKLTGDSLQQAFGKLRRLEADETLFPLLTFRGAGWEVLLLDTREGIGCPVKRYDLLFLLRRGEVEEMTAGEFRDVLARLRHEHPEWAQELDRVEARAKVIGSGPEDLLGVFGFLRLKGLREQPRRMWFELDEDEVRGRVGQVATVEGLEVLTDPPMTLQGLRRTLRRKKVVAWVRDVHPRAVRLGRALPPLFRLHELRVRRMGGALSQGHWCIAFGQDAFLLDSLWWKKEDGDAVVL